VTRETIVAAISFTCFGVLVGWILGTQQASPAPVAAAATPSASAPESGTSAPPLDIQRASDLEKRANADPSNAAVRVELGDLYFDANRFELAAPWYEASLKIDPKNIKASTDLAVSYYNLNEIDKALAQIDHSLALDPNHPTTLLDQGIIRAFGKSDLKGAIDSWKRVIDVAPNSEEAKRAKQGLDGLSSGHPGGTVPSSGGRGGDPKQP